MRRHGFFQANFSRIQTFPIVLLGLFALAFSTSGAPDIPDFALVEPGACIRRDANLRAEWSNAQALIRQRFYADAMVQLTNCLAKCPEDAATRHLAALCAWGVGQRALATRWLITAQRQQNPPPATAAALAALHARVEPESIAIGWLRRATEPLALEQRAYWATRPSLEPLWRRNSNAWRELIASLGLPEDLAVARALSVAPTIDLSPIAEEISQERMLRLSELALDESPSGRALRMRQVMMQRLVERIRGRVESADEIVIHPVDPDVSNLITPPEKASDGEEP